MFSPDTVLVIPAAGSGTRLRTAMPKLLARVNGTPMIDYLLRSYRGTVDRFVLVINPVADSAVRRHCDAAAGDLDISYVHQHEPTGMLDAILLAAGDVARRRAGRIWITWCDQIGVHPQTIARLYQSGTEHPQVPVILPTARQEPPYIHLERDQRGRIIAVRQRRENDAMPLIGESDTGLFSLSHLAYFEALPAFAAEAARSSATGERNFLPFLVWLDQRDQQVLTIPCTDDLEALGVNTPADRQRLERYLREREPA